MLFDPRRFSAAHVDQEQLKATALQTAGAKAAMAVASRLSPSQVKLASQIVRAGQQLDNVFSPHFENTPNPLLGGMTPLQAMERIREIHRARPARKANFYVRITDLNPPNLGSDLTAEGVLQLLAVDVSYNPATLTGDKIVIGGAVMDRLTGSEAVELRITTMDDEIGTLKSWFDAKCAQAVAQDGTFGFLVGELLDTNRSLLRATQQDRALWRGISADVGAIARALGAKSGAPGRSLQAGRHGAQSSAATVKPAGRGSSAGARHKDGPATTSEAAGRQRAAAQIGSGARARTVIPRSRDARGRFLSIANTRSTTSDPMPMLLGHGPALVPRRTDFRAANGRFAGGDTRGGADEAVAVGSVGGPAQAVARSVVTGLLDAAGGGASGIDPTLQAAAEIKDVVAPLGRGMFSAMGERRKESRRERWYGRILKALTRRRAADGATEAIAPGGGADSGGGLLGTMTGAMTGALGRFLPAIAAALLPVLAGLASGALGTWIGAKIYGWLDSSGILAKVFDAFDNVRSFVDDARKKATTWIGDAATGLRQGFTGNPALDASGRVIDDPRRVDAKAKTLPQRVGEAVGAGARAVADVVARPANALAQAVGNAADVVSGGVHRVIAAGKGYTEVEQADGTLSRRTGARNWRNNNPGNLEFNEYTQSLGAVGSDGRFAVFPTLDAGRQAQGKMLFEGAKYKRLDLKAAIERYAPPKENDTAGYQKSVLAAVGGANKAMSDYSPAERAAILDAMARVEGFKAGTVTPVAGPVAAVATPKLSMSNPLKLGLPVMPKLPAIPQEAAPMAASLGTKREPTVVIIQEPVGQNVRDRTIAHAVTGGLGG